MKVACLALLAISLTLTYGQDLAVPLIDSAAIIGTVGTDGSNFFDWGFTFDLPFWYGTMYEAGLGEYDSDNVWSQIGEEMHFEEYGFEFEIDGSADFTLEVGNGVQRSYAFIWSLEMEILDYEIYKQIIWWERAFANFVESGFETYELHMWLGASYKLEFGEIFLAYEESAATGGQNLLGMLTDGLSNTGAWSWTGSGNDDNTHDWDDEIYRIAVIDLLPEDI